MTNEKIQSVLSCPKIEEKTVQLFRYEDSLASLYFQSIVFVITWLITEDPTLVIFDNIFDCLLNKPLTIPF